MIQLHITITCDELGCEEFDVLSLPEAEPGDNDVPALLEDHGWHRMSEGYICESCLQRRYTEAREDRREMASQVYERNR